MPVGRAGGASDPVDKRRRPCASQWRKGERVPTSTAHRRTPKRPSGGRGRAIAELECRREVRIEPQNGSARTDGVCDRGAAPSTAKAKVLTDTTHFWSGGTAGGARKNHKSATSGVIQPNYGREKPMRIVTGQQDQR